MNKTTKTIKSFFILTLILALSTVTYSLTGLIGFFGQDMSAVADVSVGLFILTMVSFVGLVISVVWEEM